MSYACRDPWAWQGYVATAEVKLPNGQVHWEGAGELISWTAEPSYFPGGFESLAKAGAVGKYTSNLPLFVIYRTCF